MLRVLKGYEVCVDGSKKQDSQRLAHGLATELSGFAHQFTKVKHYFQLKPSHTAVRFGVKAYFVKRQAISKRNDLTLLTIPIIAAAPKIRATIQCSWTI